MVATSMELGVAQPNLEAPLELYFLHNDQLGTTINVTDSERRIVWDAHQTPFGEVNLDVEGIRMPMRFPGQYADLESGLSNNYFRDYDPSLGRYVQSDPIGLAGGSNQFAYAYSNPTKFSDSTGLCPPCVLGIAGGIIGGVSAYSGTLATGASPAQALAAGVIGAGTGALAGSTGLGLFSAAGLGLVENFAFQLAGNVIDGNATDTFRIDATSLLTSTVSAALVFGVTVKFPAEIAARIVAGQKGFAFQASVTAVANDACGR